MAKSGARDVKLNGAQSRGYSPDGIATTTGVEYRSASDSDHLMAILACIGMMHATRNGLDRK
jgi:hypothetical protein